MKIKSIPKDDLIALLNRGILINSEKDDFEAQLSLYKTIKETSKKVSLMYLNLTTQCNLLCTYCFIEQATQSQNKVMSMKFPVARKAIDKFLQELGEEEGEIIFYGGEPTLNKQVLLCSIQYVYEKNQKVKLSLVTNATLLDDELLKAFVKYDVGIGISLDGPKDINDRNRMFRNNKKSVYEVVEENISILNKRQIKYSLSSTVSKDVIENKEYIFSWLAKIPIKNVFWNIFHYSNYSNEWSDFYDKMSDFIFESYDKLFDLGIAEGKVNEHFDWLIKGHFRFHSCGAVGLNQIAVQPNGNICICQGDSRTNDHTVGNILVDDISQVINNQNESYWSSIYTIDREECRECPALYICGGGCPLQSEILFSSRESLDQASCIFYNKLVNFIVKKYYIASIN